MKDFLLFSGTSNVPLAKKLGVPLGNVEITRFIDNECRVFVKDDIAGKRAYVLQSLSEVADQRLVELCLLGAALKDLKAKQVTAVIPWMGYSKQDKAFREGEAVSMQLVAKFIEAAGFDAVITMELHSDQVLRFFHIPVTELSTHKLLAQAISVGDQTIVASPDKGGKSRASRFAHGVGLPVVHLSKTRNLATGDVIVTGIEGSVKDMDIIIFDDIINTGETAVKTSKFVKENGAKRVYFLATHAVLAGNASQVLSKSEIDRIVVTDTIAVPKEKIFDKLHIVSVAPIIASALQ